MVPDPHLIEEGLQPRHRVAQGYRVRGEATLHRKLGDFELLGKRDRSERAHTHAPAVARKQEEEP
jgi:hypothetical protein